MMLSDVCLSVAYIGPKSRTERPRKTKIGTEVAHVTHDSDTTFKAKRSKVKVTRPLCLAVQVTLWTTPYSTPPPRASRCLSTLWWGHSVAASRLQFVSANQPSSISLQTTHWLCVQQCQVKSYRSHELQRLLWIKYSRSFKHG